MSIMTPRETVEALDKYIVGQNEAKRAVAIALRNRYRRSRLPQELREEITPKNIIMMGPTGVGKTEIARRLAKLVDAPLVKVEATKFTEVGYVGRDVDSMVRDLVEASIRLCKERKAQVVRLSAEAAAEQRLIELLLPDQKRKAAEPAVNPLQLLLGAGKAGSEPELSEEEKAQRATLRDQVAARLRAGQLEEELVEVEVEQQTAGNAMLAMGIDIDLNEMMGGLIPPKKKKRRLPVKDARRILIQDETDKRIDMDEVIREAVEKAEQDGIIFIDEIDKIAGKEQMGGPDVSREGVQRDILPIVEGCTVNTKYGPVKTDFMLFIAAGAFHFSKPSDLIPELQGRFPLRVELENLTQESLYKILTQVKSSIIRQYQLLLQTEDITLEFEDEAIRELARLSFNANEKTEDIGARRLHTVIERVLEDISFECEEYIGKEVLITADMVRQKLGELVENVDLARYIL